MRKTCIENNRQVDYIPLGNYVVNQEISGEDLYFIMESNIVEYSLHRALEEFERGIPDMVEKLMKLGPTMGRDGIRLEFNMGAFRRMVK